MSWPRSKLHPHPPSPLLTFWTPFVHLLAPLPCCHWRSSGGCTPVRYEQWDRKSVTIATEPGSGTTDRQDNADSPNISDSALQWAHANMSALSGGQCTGYISHHTFLPGRCFQQWPLNRNSESLWAGEARVNKNTTHRPGPSPAGAALKLQHI